MTRTSILSRWLCKQLGKHRLTLWRRIPSLAVQSRHCKRRDCAFIETRPTPMRTRIVAKTQLREVNASDTTQGMG